MSYGLYMQMSFYLNSFESLRSNRLLSMLQLVGLVAAIYIVFSTADAISLKESTPHLNKVLSWFILGTSFIQPLFCDCTVLNRLLSIVLAFFPPFLLMSITHESLFYLALCFVLMSWIFMEHSTIHKVGATDLRKTISCLKCLSFGPEDDINPYRPLSPRDCWTAYLFIFLIVTAFFGTGNIASINSFDPSSVYCYMTVFNPFVMGALLMWKVVAPFVLVTCASITIQKLLKTPVQDLLILMLGISDLMGLNFFFLIKDSGSWLSIGTSISHYVIVMAMITFVMVLMGLANLLTTVNLNRNTKHHKQ